MSLLEAQFYLLKFVNVRTNFFRCRSAVRRRRSLWEPCGTPPVSGKELSKNNLNVM